MSIAGPTPFTEIWTPAVVNAVMWGFAAAKCEPWWVLKFSRVPQSAKSFLER